MNPADEWRRFLTRRQFLRGSFGLGALALAALRESARAGDTGAATPNLLPKKPMIPPKAKHVIYLHMAGGPPQQELFDWKPKLVQYHLKPCPKDLLQNQRFAFIKGHPLLLGTPFKFQRHGKAGRWVSELLPKLTGVIDELAFVRTVWTDQFNHAPAEMFLFTGSPRPDGASLGSWVTYGLGSENQNLPGFVVLISGGTDPTGGKALWSSGFLPSVYQGVQCRSAGEPILFANNPRGMDPRTRRRSLDALQKLNQLELQEFGDPETLTRINQYELAFRMQSAVPEVANLAKESPATLAQYGAQPGQGSFANNCLLARRLVESGVRFVQLFDWGWDCHGTGAGDDIVTHLPNKCRAIDRPIAALLRDLRQRGLLDETLVVWGGEFGRTSMNEARDGSQYLGRDHHPHCFTMWLAGGGIKGGAAFGETDELGYFPITGKTSVRDLQATILTLLGIDPYRFFFKYLGLNQRLIGPTNDGKVIREIVA